MAERDEQFTELPLDSPGTRLRRAREAAGLTLADIAARTKIAERHLASIEADAFSALASRAYAVGFSRSYARAVGVDEQDIANLVRQELDGIDASGDRHQTMNFEPGDPSRVPSSKVAWIAAAAALAVIVGGFLFWQSSYSPGSALPDLTSEQPAQPAPPPAAALPPATVAQGPVVFTALAPAVWVKFYDGAGNQLMQKELALGESYTVPADAAGPMVWTARPNELQVTVGGQVVPKLSDSQVTVKDVPVTAAALLARPQAGAVASPVSSPSPPAAAVQAPAVAPRTVASPKAATQAPRPSPAASRSTAAAAPAPVRAQAAGLPAMTSNPVVQSVGGAAAPQSSTVSQSSTVTQ